MINNAGANNALYGNMVIAGVDEVGRGCWAGPLVVGAVILDKPIDGLRDSKKLTKSKRQTLALLVEQNALFCKTGWAWPAEIDELGLTAATSLALSRALIELPACDLIIIDGSVNYLPDDHRTRLLPKADDLIPAVSAASIVAKVARDKYMEGESRKYPNYGFGSHVGYGTETHKQALKLYGVTDIHRISYKPIKDILQLS